MIQADADLSRLDRAIVNAFQGGFPVVEHPFEPAAAALRERGVDVTETELCDQVKALDESGVLSRFGALVNAEEIGGTATLVAMHAPPERFDEVAEQVNAHREVAHNYEREHPHLNMWFVVSVASESRVDEVLGEIESETGQQTYNMPKRHEFHVGAKFLLDGPVSDGDLDCSHLGPDVEPSGEQTLTPDERDLVLEIQGGLPITETPYADVAEALEQDTAWVVETIKRFNLEGKVRRVGVIPNHYALGYSENGMTVWNVPDDLVMEVGPEIASLDFVTHCYRRPRHEGVWPYNFFAMTHGRSEEESQARIERVREVMSDYWQVGDDDWDTLFSTRILKKTGIRLDERADANTE
ncbi:Lrp/AsnC family transcriptional regulator [Haloferax mediterranei ATCC 33500]|uniref:siroheme decarboxylase n=1 Tax=Haloferax mediterranei (strain ATCC 33500 / DSM 1411 / JCM 8866 / NBRC 14739 / NCIMB 2177 / R-4) TaxID=523841 RepID=I3R700_HALMT|nr:Lrp/AsnC family transcriptional regulator [Haloferax mediterranei]AFK20010.1 heme biosynthesis protein nirH/G (nirL/nirD-like protein) [Haloferax mediterranei ATCC 33500]AHZ23388.1 heme biosynthesis protein [Haloferax mediterranei ATCC 33500]ELZ99557.1 heme biosynthesis protein nirH/G (nirL/nirD-like protein) [Haloferax mediterranei ATCC 33500]MDX5987238.1 Lrp/AsnC family transcriptional regulator [Haloferax mediterranei ATCC 33500]QCQ73760.1 Lrp/AsnC family transcriptional regulator [Halof